MPLTKLYFVSVRNYFLMMSSGAEETKLPEAAKAEEDAASSCDRLCALRDERGAAQ